MDRSQPVKSRWIESPLVRWSFLIFLGGIIAVSMFARMVHLPTNALGHYSRALTDIEAERFQEAVDNLTQAISASSDNPDYFISRGYARVRMGETSGALSDYEEAIKLAPFDAKAYAGRGYTKERSGNLEAAIEDYTKAISLDPRNSDAYQGRASALERLGDEDAALGDYTVASQLAPAEGLCYLKRANLHFDQKRWQEASYGFERASELLQDPRTQSRARLMAWLARAWLGERGGSATQLGGGPKNTKVDGPDAAFLNRVLFLTGKLSGEALIASAGSGTTPGSAQRRCEAYFLAGNERMIAKETGSGLAFLQRALAEPARDFYAADRSRAMVRNALLGMRVMSAGTDLIERLGLDPSTGLSISSLRDGGSAARAGLLEGDVLVKLDGKPATMGALLAIEDGGKSGSMLDLELVREGRKQLIRLTLGG